MENMEKYYEHLHLRTYDAKLHTAPIGAESLIFTGGRNEESLDGMWKCMPDVFDTIIRKELYGPVKRDTNGMEIPTDYAFGDGFDIAIPGSVNLADPHFYLYEGSTVYTRAFTYYEEKKGERVFIRFGAANYECRVFLNGEYLGRHIGGFTPFAIELTGKLKEKNELLVIVNNRRSFEQVPSENYDWFNYGGLTRSVSLYRVPESFIKDLHVSLVPDGTYGHIKTGIEVDGKIDEAVIRIPALGLEKKISLAGGHGEVILDASPELWSPDNPFLYEVSAEAGDDKVSDKVGFREIRTDGKKILLNGKEIFLKGICCHEESSKGGRSLSDEERMMILRTAKELGCNALRLTHYPHSERMSQLADEIGIMLWEEIPVYWLIDFENPETLLNASNQLKELMRRDYNRASVIIWSVGNENPDTDSRLNFMSKLASICKEYDKTRLVSAACLVNIDSMAICDRLCDVVDIISFNQYYGWYFRSYDGLKQILDNSHVDKPLMISETGAGCDYGHHGTAEELFTEEHQARVYEYQIRYSDGRIQGFFPWILYDFRSPIRMNPYQTGCNRKGLVSDDKVHRKKAFYVLQEYYRSRK